MLVECQISYEEVFCQINKPVGMLTTDTHLYYVESCFEYFELLPSVIPCKRKLEVGCCHLTLYPEILLDFRGNSFSFHILESIYYFKIIEALVTKVTLVNFLDKYLY